MLQKELAKRLRGRFETEPDGDGWLAVSSDGMPLCRVKYNGNCIVNDNPYLSEEYLGKIAEIQNELLTVKEYVGLYEHAPQMKAADVSEYRQFASFGDTVLAAKYSENHGFEFVTWKQNTDGNAVFWGDYSSSYMGDALLQKSCTTEVLPFRKVKNDGRLPQYYVENSNPPIVSKETYEAAQTLMRSRKTESCKRKKYPLTGKLRCPDCGRTFRHQTVNGTAYWLCGGRSSGAENCRNRRVREDAVYAAFADMVMKLKTYRTELLGTLIRQMETMQNRTSRNQERIRQIDKEIADLGAKNLIITRMHTSGALDAAEYAGQTAVIGNRITELRIERRKKLAEDENDAMIDRLKELYETLEEYEPTAEFDEALFNEIAESITVDSNAQLTFRLMGGIELTEEIGKKGRCKAK